VREIRTESPHLLTRDIYKIGAQVRKKRAAGEDPVPCVKSKRPKHCGRHSKLDDQLHTHNVDIPQCCANYAEPQVLADGAFFDDEPGIWPCVEKTTAKRNSKN
jgi:hypothetical protein